MGNKEEGEQEESGEVRAVLIAGLAFVAIGACQPPPSSAYIIPPPKVDTPTEAWRKAEEARQIQLQNRLLEQELRERQAPRAREGAIPPVPEIRQSADERLKHYQTDGVRNGVGWRSFNSEMKLAYLTGMTDALSVTETGKDYIPGNLSWGEIGSWLDRIYSNPLNDDIPVLAALRLLAMRAGGFSEDDLNRSLAIARKIYAEAKNVGKKAGK